MATDPHAPHASTRHVVGSQIVAMMTMLFSTGCGAEVAAGGVKTPLTADDTRFIDAPESIIPEDLDLVVRIDLQKFRQGLGPLVAGEILERSLDEAHVEGLTRKAFSDARVVHLATRVADAESGDRVMVVQTKGDIELDPLSFTKDKDPPPGVTSYRARGAGRRADTAQIVVLAPGKTAFISPVEVRSVDRVLRLGPDLRRGQPEARGVMSFDYRPGPIGFDFRRAFPSLAGLIGGIVRVRGTVEVKGASLELEARFSTRRPAAAEKIHRFLNTIVTTASRRPDLKPLLAGITFKQRDAALSVKWSVPPALLIRLLRATGESPEPAATAPDINEPTGDKTTP